MEVVPHFKKLHGLEQRKSHGCTFILSIPKSKILVEADGLGTGMARSADCMTRAESEDLDA